LLTFTLDNGCLEFIQLQSWPCSCAALANIWFLRFCRSSVLSLGIISLSSSWTKIFQDSSNSSQFWVVDITRLYNWCKMLRWLFSSILNGVDYLGVKSYILFKTLVQVPNF
jgi:hypothetical protein